MAELTTKERFIRTYERRDLDRLLMIDSPWHSTVERWKREGMPGDADWHDYFGFDRRIDIFTDNSPRYEEKILEDTPDYTIKTTKWGATMREFKATDTTPEFLDYKVCTKEMWEEAKARMTPDDDRINFKQLEANYEKWKQNGEWLSLYFWFGFDVTHSWMAGTDTVLIGMYEDPDWIRDMIDHYLSVNIALAEKMLARGYKFDAIFWPDDMGYKGSQFFSKEMYREIVRPYHKKAADWAHEHGMYVEMHSCGCVEPFIPDLIDIGIDSLNPIEVKAGMDPVKIKQTYGDRIALRGGINAAIWDKTDEICEEISRVIPKMKENYGYVFSSDHSIPSSVSLSDFRTISDLIRRLGRY